MVVISIPFSASCTVPEFLDDLFTYCDTYNIPILIDFAYISISRNVQVDLNHPCIDTLCFSLSKCYFGIERLRVGLRLTRKFIDDPLDFLNEFNQVNTFGALIGLKLLKRLHPQDLYSFLEPALEEICLKNHYIRNNTSLFVNLDTSHPDYLTYKRGESIFARKCVSEELSEFFN